MGIKPGNAHLDTTDSDVFCDRTSQFRNLLMARQNIILTWDPSRHLVRTPLLDCSDTAPSEETRPTKF
jgi:hypothetical protein